MGWLAGGRKGKDRVAWLSHLPCDRHRKYRSDYSSLFHIVFLRWGKHNNDLASVIAIVRLWLQIHCALTKVSWGSARQKPGCSLQSTPNAGTFSYGFCTAAIFPWFQRKLNELHCQAGAKGLRTRHHISQQCDLFLLVPAFKWQSFPVYNSARYCASNRLSLGRLCSSP